MVSVLASSFEHPACRLFEIRSEFGFVYVTEMLERISDAIQLVGGRFAIPWRVTIEAAIAGDLQATPVHSRTGSLLLTWTFPVSQFMS
ncbi:hypothetical protein [Burkholderia cenocepacia]|uniref:hypothetical protein n=1 Tax=Burkholderia cenocepacia TaxID=95486 RepID=UPI0023B92B33|nr:hypothetical protein [Burkholderia cenocepacia]MDF0503686.1 hypothetical protein [Burkholderia cenocepacia]MDR5643846.1 hypothetical protein [Burkholderia cenocepacia]